MTQRRPTSLRTRLFAAMGIVAVLSVALAFAIGAVLTRRAVERNTLRDLSAQADVLAARERGALLPLARLKDLKPLLDRQQERVIQVTLDGSSPYLPESQALELRRGRAVNGSIEVDGTRYLFAARPVTGKGFILLRPASRVTSDWLPHVKGLLIGALAAAALAGLVAFLLARALARPVRRIAQATRSLAAGADAPRVPVEGPRELATLAESFNDMAEQLARARAAERSFLLSVSHELKTPLTAIRGYAEGLGEGVLPADEAAATISRESARLERLVQDLLDLARMRRSEFSVRRERVDLGAVAVECAQRYEPQALGFQVTLDADVQGSAAALADTDRVFQVVSNLVENALRLTPPDGAVRIVASSGFIAVEDTGPGLKPEELPHAFERFYLYSRYGAERSVGTGLGLAIVKELVEGMGGSVEAASGPGRPTTFTVRLPVPADDAQTGADVLRPPYEPRIPA